MNRINGITNKYRVENFDALKDECVVWAGGIGGE